MSIDDVMLIKINLLSKLTETITQGLYDGNPQGLKGYVDAITDMEIVLNEMIEEK